MRLALVIPERDFREGFIHIPRFYGRAYFLCDRIAWVFLPVPLNWLVAGVRRLWYWFLRGPKAPARERELLNAYQAGRRDGTARAVETMARAREVCDRSGLKVEDFF